MKSLSFILITLLTLSCKAQTIDNLYRSSSGYGSEGYYYKDTGNDLNSFEGTWLYAEGNVSFEMILTKKEMLHITVLNDNYYTDALIGGYNYKVNGNEVINTLASINDTHNSVFKYNIGGNKIRKFGTIFCEDCTAPNQIKISAIFDQPDCDNGPPNYFNMRYFTEAGMEKLEVVFKQNGAIRGSLNANNTTPPDCTQYLVPFGRYVFTKQ